MARFGGDEFVVLLEDVASVEEAISAARRICVAVEEPLILSDGYEVVASVSAGIALTRSRTSSAALNVAMPETENQAPSAPARSNSSAPDV